jgi:hypothetical protein
VPPPVLIRAGLDALPSFIRAQGERASRRFIEFFTANIRNRNTRMAYARAVKNFFDFKNPILRLGPTGGTYAKLLAQGSINHDPGLAHRKATQSKCC